jgi:hypothetical protein
MPIAFERAERLPGGKGIMAAQHAFEWNALGKLEPSLANRLFGETRKPGHLRPTTAKMVQLQFPGRPVQKAGPGLTGQLALGLTLAYLETDTLKLNSRRNRHFRLRRAFGLPG